jgi:hypothetical protein
MEERASERTRINWYGLYCYRDGDESRPGRRCFGPVRPFIFLHPSIITPIIIIGHLETAREKRKDRARVRRRRTKNEGYIHSKYVLYGMRLEHHVGILMGGGACQEKNDTRSLLRRVRSKSQISVHLSRSDVRLRLSVRRSLCRCKYIARSR